MAGARNTRCNERLEQRAAHDVFDIPTTKNQRAQVSGRVHSRRPGAQRQRHRRLALRARRRPGYRRRPGAQRPRHRRRARSARRRWQPAAAPPGTQARSALGAERREPSAERRAQNAEREAAIRLAASARARSARAIGAPGDHPSSTSTHSRKPRTAHTALTVKLEPYKLGGYCLLAPL